MSSYICTVCRDLLTNPRDMAPGLSLIDYQPVVLQCGHIFHKFCLNTWMDGQVKSKKQASCQTCCRHIRPHDIIKMHPTSDENFPNHHSLIEQVQQKDMDIAALCAELQLVSDKLSAAQNAYFDLQATLVEQNEVIEHHQQKEDVRMPKMYLEANAGELAAEPELESLRSKLAAYKKMLKEKSRESRNYKSTLQSICKALQETEVPCTVVSEQTTDDSSKENAVQHYFLQTHRVLDKIRSLLSNHESNDLLPPELKSENAEDTAEDPIFPVIIQTAIFGRPLSFSDKEMVASQLALIGTLPDAPRELKVILYIPRGGVFCPSLELFQLHLATLLRISKISHQLETIKIFESENVPVMKIGKEIIYHPEICTSLIKEAAAAVHPNSPANANLPQRAELLKMFWGLLLWQWSCTHGDWMTIYPNDDSGRFADVVREKIKEMTKGQSFANMETSEVTAMLIDGIRILARELDDKKYFSGSEPGETDSCAFVLLTQILWNTPGSRLAEEITDHDNLVTFVFNMKHTFWPEWEAGTSLPRFWMPCY